jgi:hypothetical protein
MSIIKKIFIISLGFLGITLIFLGVYNFAFKKNTPVVQAPAENTTQKPAAQKVPPKITAISSQPVLSPIFDNKNEIIIYYSAKDGTAWSIKADGSGAKQISSTTLPGLVDAIWFSGGNKVLTKFEKGGQTYFYTYNYKEKRGTSLKKGIDVATWDYTGAKIFYKYYDEKTKKRSLNIANPDGSEWQSLTNITFRNISIAAVPLASVVSYWNLPDVSQETLLQTISLAGGQPQTILKGRFGADYLWSPDGKQALVSSLANIDSKMVTLGLVSLDGKYTELNIPTLVSKCVWSSDGKTFFYALPGGIPDGAIMPNDYQNKKFTTKDTFWKVDITTGQKSRLVETKDILSDYDSINLFLSPTQDALYFVNKIDGKLYRIAL